MVDNTTDINKIIVGYSPGDFFYSSVENTLTADQCASVLADAHLSDKCNEANFEDNQDTCIQAALCKNSQNVKQIYDRNKTKSENHERSMNAHAVYMTEYITMWNLGIAIVGLLIAIYYLFWGSNVVKVAGDLVEGVSSRFSGPGAVEGEGEGAVEGQTGNLGRARRADGDEGEAPPETEEARRGGQSGRSGRGGSPRRLRR
jgi:hypothetical protein